MNSQPARARALPRRGTARGLPGIEVHLGINVHGPAGSITITAVAGTVTAVTGSPGRAVRSCTPVPPPRHRGRGLAGTAGAVISGSAGIITLRGFPGTVQAVTGSPGRTVRSRTRIPPHRGAGRGMPGTIGIRVAGIPGQVVLNGTAGGISISVNGTAGVMAITAPAGFVVLTPYRYLRWDIGPGFSRTAPRSHLITGSPGIISVRAPAGSVSATQGTEGTPDSAQRITRPRIFLPLRRGKAK